MKQLTVHVNESLVEAIRVACFETRKTKKELVTEAVETYLKNLGIRND